MMKKLQLFLGLFITYFALQAAPPNLGLKESILLENNNILSLKNNTIPTKNTTISLWFKGQDFSSQQTLVFWGPTTGCNPSAQILKVENGKIVFQVGCGSSAKLVSTDTVIANYWYHVAVTIDATHKATLYQNGKVVASGNPTAGQAIAGGVNIIGAQYGGGALTSYFTGNIYNVSIWNKELTSEEVKNTQNLPLGNEADLIWSRSYQAAIPDNCHTVGYINKEYFELTDNAIPKNNVTLMFWVKAVENDNNSLVFWGPKSGCNPSAQFLKLENGKLSLGAGCASGQKLIGEPIFKNVWTHVAVTIDGTQTGKLYQNGVLVAEGKFDNGNSIATGSCLIGAQYEGGVIAKKFNGYLDDFSIWNTVLTETDIKQYMGVLTGSENGLTHLFDFNELTNSTVVSKVSNSDVLSFSHEFDGTQVKETQTSLKGSDLTVVLTAKATDVSKGTLLFWGPKSGCNPSAQILKFKNGQLQFNSGCGTPALSGTTLSANKEYNIILRINNTGEADVFVDGVKVIGGQNTRKGQSVLDFANLYLGAQYGGGVLNDYFTGSINQVLVYNSYLTDQEILSIVAGGTNNATIVPVGKSLTWADGIVGNGEVSIDTGVNLNGNTLTSKEVTANAYQWIDCDTDQMLMMNNMISFDAQSTGNYKVQINKHGCIKESSCENVIITNITSSIDDEITVYPNPTETFLYLNQVSDWKIINLLGQEKLSGTSSFIDVSSLVIGQYILILENTQVQFIKR